MPNCHPIFPPLLAHQSLFITCVGRRHLADKRRSGTQKAGKLLCLLSKPGVTRFTTFGSLAAARSDLAALARVDFGADIAKSIP